MRKTTNYGLVLYDSTDKMNITGSTNSLNASMEIIDSKLKEIDNKPSSGGAGLTMTQINALDGMFKVCAYIKEDISAEYSAFINAFVTGGDTPDTPDTPTGKTLVSIKATYTGGNVLVGTSVDSLTGLIVEANYSDGTSENVTGYTLFGSIAEGSNIITVSYDGKTTTITVTGVAESGGGNTPVEMTKYGAYSWKAGTEYSDNGSTAYSGTVGSATGSFWCSEVFDKDTEVSVSILYGITNSNLRQYCACISEDTELTEGGTNDINLYYFAQIGTALTTEYTATYTVRAGYRLGIINYNAGEPQSISVVTA